jgi:Arm DNA-binding domain
MKLDAKTVVALRLDGKKDAIFFDDTLVGFGLRLRLSTSGKVLRSWIAQYRRAGATRRMLLGSAEVLTADKARAAAKEVLAKVALGQDPQADRADQRDSDRLTFRKGRGIFGNQAAAVATAYLRRDQALPDDRVFQAATQHAARYDQAPGCRPAHSAD